MFSVDNGDNKAIVSTVYYQVVCVFETTTLPKLEKLHDQSLKDARDNWIPLVNDLIKRWFGNRNRLITLKTDNIYALVISKYITLDNENNRLDSK